MRLLFAICLLLAPAFPAAAITFAEGEEPDPFAEGETCPVRRLASYGSYIYSYPSKYDLVFEPFVSLIWSCPKSGYISYAGDFSDLSDDERTRIAAFLAEHPWRPEFETPEGYQAKLDQMEAIYALRQRTRQEQAYLMRARAWLYGNDPKADEYRVKALVLHKEILEKELPQGTDRIESLYIVGYYTWKLGDRETAEPYFEEARNVLWTDNDGTEHTGSPYINGLIDEIKADRAGGGEPSGGGE
jgi:hypothetical protein